MLSGQNLASSLVSFPDPAPKEGKGLVYIERFLGLDDVSVLNSVAPIRFMLCGLHVIIMWHLPIAVYSARVRVVDALPCQNDALSCQSHDMLHPVCPRKRSMCTRPFPSLRMGSGNETTSSLAPIPSSAAILPLFSMQHWNGLGPGPTRLDTT